MLQFKSVNFTFTDASGAAEPDVALRINNADDDTQEPGVQISAADGSTTEVLAQLSTGATQFGPFRIRVRKYGFVWSALSSPIADAIKQSSALNVDANVTQTEAVAQAHAGITVTDHGNTPVSWDAGDGVKDYGITVTVTSGVSADDVRHYLSYHLAQIVAFEGRDSGLDWHNMAPLSTTQTTRGDYGGTQKGVRVVDGAGDPFPGFTAFQSDDGTFGTPPVSAVLTIANIITGSALTIFDDEDPDPQALGTILESDAAIVGTTYQFVHSKAGDDIVVQMIASGYEEINLTVPLTGLDQSIVLNPNLEVNL